MGTLSERERNMIWCACLIKHYGSHACCVQTKPSGMYAIMSSQFFLLGWGPSGRHVTP